jgi:hypothetical protein
MVEYQIQFAAVLGIYSNDHKPDAQAQNRKERVRNQHIDQRNGHYNLEYPHFKEELKYRDQYPKNEIPNQQCRVSKKRMMHEWID